MAATTANAPSGAANRGLLLQWFNSLRPLKVDIVGDFAGKELFAMHGEAMFAHCMKEAGVDFNRETTGSLIAYLIVF